jgi:exopolysaccharide biosynthesis operon protein EpsL
MLVQRGSWLTPTLLLAFGAAPAWAQSDGPLQLKMSYTMQSDSNLLRLPAGASVNTLTGKPGAAERIGVTSVGVDLNKAYSLQRLELNLNLTNYRYQNFSYLSYVAHNYNAAWRWSLTPRFHGSLTSDRAETLNSFADYQGFNLRNQRTDISRSLDAEYEFGGPLRVVAGVSRSSRTNLQPLVGEGDSSANAADLGLRYLWASGNVLSYSHKNTNGSYSNRLLPLVAPYDDGFKQLDHDLRLHWVISGQTTADIGLTHINRIHPNYAQSDYSGVNKSINFNWNISGKSALTAGWTRELASYQTGSINYTQTDRFSFGPVWQFSPKTIVRLQLEAARRDYLGTSTAVLARERSDSTRDTSLSLDWRPYRFLSVSAALQNARRSSDQTGFDYDSKLTTLSAHFIY